MFINISNHSSTKWGEYQKEEAKRLGGVIIDIPFPQIDPLASAAEVRESARNAVEEISLKYGTRHIIHVMGEQTYCFAFIQEAMRFYYHACVASTTRREVVEVTNPDGTVTKTAIFEFVQFRQY